MRRGAVLLFALIVLSITVITTAGLSTYYAHSMNIAKFYESQRSSRRVGATRALRTSLDKVMERLSSLANKSGGAGGAAVSLNVQGKTMAEVMEALQKEVPASLTVDGETYTLKTAAAGDTLTIRVFAGGVEIMNAAIELGYSSTMNTLPVFDYVYFADNNGQLTSDYIIANGEVGSNGDFDLKGATVNGFLNYLNTIRLSGSPRAWLQGAYMTKIAKEFEISSSEQVTVEQVRPTNPAIYVDGGATKSVAWPGGYEALFASNPYTWTEQPPDPVSPPGDKPEKPTTEDITYRTSDSKDRPK